MLCCQQLAGVAPVSSSERKADGHHTEGSRRSDGGVARPDAGAAHVEDSVEDGGIVGDSSLADDGGTTLVPKGVRARDGGGEGQEGSEQRPDGGRESEVRDGGSREAESRDGGARQPEARDGGAAEPHDGEAARPDGGREEGDAEHRDGGEARASEGASDGGRDREANVGPCVTAGKSARRAGTLDAWFTATCAPAAPTPAPAPAPPPVSTSPGT